MIPTRSFQEWIHWLELGPGAHAIRRVAIGLGVVLLSLWICNKQFHGPKTEATLRQAVVARQLADGAGYTTLVNDPATAFFMQQHGHRWDAAPFPELQQAPLYPAVLSGVLQILPMSVRSVIFTTSPTPPDGFIPDYILLGTNVILLWLAAGLTYLVGRRLFDRAVGIVSALAVILSAPIWQHVVAVDGTSLAMVILLALIHAVLRVEQSASSGVLPIRWLLVSGLWCGALFLLDYENGLCVVSLCAYMALRFAGERFRASATVVAGFLIVASPWCTWLITQTLSPVGFAWQEIAQKVDGTSADPAIVRATFSAIHPVFDLAKIGNKGLSGIQLFLGERLWSGGGLWFCGFFVASFLYKYREDRVNSIRGLIVALVFTLVLASSFLDSGEGERLPATIAAPLLIILGVGFSTVLISSSELAASRARWILAALLCLQGIPLVKDALEPRRVHFQYPPYFPPLFLGMREEMWRRAGSSGGWMADVPAGAAWYSGQRVWGQPATLRDFFAIGVEQPMFALVLTPRTLDRPFFTELARKTEASDGRFGEWAQVYESLITRKPVTGFPLSMPQKIADNFYVLIDPLAQPVRHR